MRQRLSRDINFVDRLCAAYLHLQRFLLISESNLEIAMVEVKLNSDIILSD